jgi:hypothetical protein
LKVKDPFSILPFYFSRKIFYFIFELFEREGDIFSKYSLEENGRIFIINFLA